MIIAPSLPNIFAVYWDNEKNNFNFHSKQNKKNESNKQKTYNLNLEIYKNFSNEMLMIELQNHE